VQFEAPDLGDMEACMNERTGQLERRGDLRFDAVFSVVVSSEEFGKMKCMARNISNRGMFIEARDVLPLGTEVRVHFLMDAGQGEIVARAVIKNHYFLSYSGQGRLRRLVGMGLRFVEFEQGDNDYEQAMNRYRVLH